ncbi:MAG: hypothetical protein KatS3mg129_2190 [Leptospiraceae bacterium]|nr:MAG: hypothetical protein KatS3mg129_2190 [Leptospiraceae bacterium]
MKNYIQKYEILIPLILFIGIGILSRIVDHLPNFTPIVGITLFIVSIWNRRFGMLFVILTLFISNLILGYGFDEVQVVVYISLLFPVLLGKFINRKSSVIIKYVSIVSISILSSILFYLTTNFAVWLWSGMYEHTLYGLTLCYEMALPFFRNTFAGDLFSSLLIFGIYDVFLYLKKFYALYYKEV